MLLEQNPGDNAAEQRINVIASNRGFKCKRSIIHHLSSSSVVGGESVGGLVSAFPSLV